MGLGHPSPADQYWYNSVLVGKQLLIFWGSCCLQLLLLLRLHRHRTRQQQAPLRHQYLFTSWNDVIFQKTWIITTPLSEPHTLPSYLTHSISVTSCSIGPLLWIDTPDWHRFYCFRLPWNFPSIMYRQIQEHLILSMYNFSWFKRSHLWRAGTRS